MMTDMFWLYVWPMLWQSAILAVAVGGLTFLFRDRLQPQWRYLLWGIVLVRFAMPILPSSPLGLFPAQHHDKTAANDIADHAVIDSTVSNDVTFGNAIFTMTDITLQTTEQPLPQEYKPVLREEILPPSSDATRSAISLWQYAAFSLFCVWAAGVAFFAFRYASGEIWLRLLCRQVGPTNNTSLCSMLSVCRQEMQLRRRVRIYVVPQEIEAASFGVLFPRIIISEQVAEQISADVLRFVLLHELTHIKRFDPVVHFFVRCVSIFHWLNPVFRFVRLRLECEREYACDAAVLHKLERKNHRQYGEMVLTFAERCMARHTMPRRYFSALVGVFSDRDIKRRITMIIKHKPSRLRHTLLGAMFITLFVLIGLTTAQTVAVNQPQESSGTEKQAVENKEEKKADEKPLSSAPVMGHAPYRGKVFMPDGTPAVDFKISYAFGGGRDGAQNNGDGTFEGDAIANSFYTLAAFDPNNKLAAPLYLGKTTNTPYEEDIVFRFVEGTKVRGTVTDTATGKPVARQDVYLWWGSEQVRYAEGDDCIVHRSVTNEKGEYEFCVFPQGKLGVSVAWHGPFL